LQQQQHRRCLTNLQLLQLQRRLGMASSGSQSSIRTQSRQQQLLRL
jgi:hypothetical protein